MSSTSTRSSPDGHSISVRSVGTTGTVRSMPGRKTGAGAAEARRSSSTVRRTNDEEGNTGMILVSIEELEEMINDIPEIHGYARKQLDDGIDRLPVRGVIRDCDGCFGASFNDCKDCGKLVQR